MYRYLKQQNLLEKIVHIPYIAFYMYKGICNIPPPETPESTLKNSSHSLHCFLHVHNVSFMSFHRK